MVREGWGKFGKWNLAENEGRPCPSRLPNYTLPETVPWLSIVKKAT